MPIWATHPRIQEGELLSSWLVRIAAECGMTLSQFGQIALPVTNKRQVLGPRVIDRNPSDILLQAISEGTGTSLERIREATLLAEEGYLFSQDGRGQLRWIAPTHSSQTAKYDDNSGLPYCPECLRQDNKPYYRKLWRYSFFAICPIHRMPLRNTCPHCNQPYSNLIPFAQKNIDLNNPITGCRSCGRNICDAPLPSDLDDALLDQSLAIQGDILTIIRQGGIELPDYGFVYSLAYLNALYSILQTLTLHNASRSRMSYISALSGIEFDHQVKLGNLFGRAEFDRSIGADRAILLCLGSWLMGEWPSRVIAYGAKFEIELYRVFLNRGPSLWISTTIPIKHKQSVGKLSEEELANVKALMRRKPNIAPAHEITKLEVTKFINSLMTNSVSNKD